jgi:hypothetical protein
MEKQTFSPLLRIRCLRSPIMTAKGYFSRVMFCCCLPLLILSCGEKQNNRPPHFTRIDSLTETYLVLQDSMLQSWNAMINDDNHKIDVMHSLIHEILVSGSTDPELLKAYDERVNQLKRSRYTQKTMANNDIVEEYDFASNALVAELITLAESQRQFAYNTTLQKLTDDIRIADQRVARYREQYDQITARYNAFLDENKNHLKEIDSDSFLEKKPLFHMVAED